MLLKSLFIREEKLRYLEEKRFIKRNNLRDREKEKKKRERREESRILSY